VRTASIIMVMKESVRTSEASVYSNETIRRYIPEGSHLHENEASRSIKYKEFLAHLRDYKFLKDTASYKKAPNETHTSCAIRLRSSSNQNISRVWHVVILIFLKIIKGHEIFLLQAKKIL
jgi:hypothetical protein